MMYFNINIFFPYGSTAYLQGPGKSPFVLIPVWRKIWTGFGRCNRSGSKKHTDECHEPPNAVLLHTFYFYSSRKTSLLIYNHRWIKLCFRYIPVHDCSCWYSLRLATVFGRKINHLPYFPFYDVTFTPLIIFVGFSLPTNKLNHIVLNIQHVFVYISLSDLVMELKRFLIGCENVCKETVITIKPPK